MELQIGVEQALQFPGLCYQRGNRGACFVHEGPFPLLSSHHVYTPPNTQVCTLRTPPQTYTHTPNTCAHTHPHPLPTHHIPTRSLHFSRGRRQSKPTPKYYFLPKTKQSRTYQLCTLPLSFFSLSRKGPDMIKSMFLNETKKASDTICDTFISVPG